MAASRHSPNLVSVGDHVDAPCGRGYVVAVEADQVQIDTGWSISMNDHNGTPRSYWPTAKYSEVEHV